MKLRNVKDLKAYLELHSLSPERFAALCGISNMTVRRWVKHEDAFSLPSKYWPLFDHALIPQTDALESSALNSFSFEHGFADLEKHVHDLGVNAHTPEQLEVEFAVKAKDTSIAQGLLDKVKLLFKALVSPKISNYQRSLVLGAITYFISPIDLIPDMTPIIGYLDDYAVISMVITSVGPALVRKTTSSTKA